VGAGSAGEGRCGGCRLLRLGQRIGGAGNGSGIGENRLRTGLGLLHFWSSGCRLLQGVACVSSLGDLWGMSRYR
jgi:hypothetical protein